MPQSAVPGLHKSVCQRAALRLVKLFTLVAASVAFASLGLAQDRVTLSPTAEVAPAASTLLGATPDSQPLTGIVLELRRTAAQQADLDNTLAALGTVSSAQYRHWFTPAAFAARFARAADALAPLTAWLTANGVTIDSTSSGGTRLSLSGTAASFTAAFGAPLRNYVAPDQTITVVSTTQPSVPASRAASVRSVSFATTAALAALAAQVDANDVAILTVDASGTANADRFTAVFEQASAQGQTVLTLHAASLGSPARAVTLNATAHVTGRQAIAVETDPAAASPVITTRPTWQTAPGLADDGLRATPDATVPSDMTTLAAGLQSLVTTSGVRQGELAASLYRVAPVAGVFTHADSTVAVGTWTAADGLGTVNVDALVHALDTGTTPTNGSILLSSRTVTHGTTITLTATITGSGTAKPTGTVTFASTQAGILSTANLDSTGAAVYSTNQLVGGLYGFYATYNGDSTYATSNTNTDTATVNPETARVTPTVPASTGVGGSIPVTVTVTAPSGVGTPSGTVTLYPYGTDVASSTFTGTLVPGTAGSASVVVPVPASNAGTFMFQANCASSANFSCGTPASVLVTVAKGTPTVLLTKAAGASPGVTTLTATVAAPTGSTSAAPSSAVNFQDAGVLIGTGTLARGVATYDATLSGGTHTLTAVYAGDTNYATVTSAPLVTTIAPIVTTTSLTSSSGYSGPYGSTFSLISVVTPASYVTAGTAPSGTITITSATQGLVGTGTLSGGTVTITSAALNVGTQTLTATYSGDGNYAASSTTVPTVITITKASATLTAALSPTGTIPYGYDVNLNATVAITGATTAPAGNITATISGTGGSVYTGTLSGSAGTSTVSISFPAPPPGTYTITVACATPTNYSCTPITLKLTTSKGSTATTLSLTPNQPQAGVPVTVTAVVANTGTGSGTYTYTGSVGFYSNGKFLRSAPISVGQVTTTITLATSNTQAITAIYSGDTNWNGSTSDPTTVTPGPLPSTTSVTASTMQGVVGQNITIVATVNAGGIVTALIPTGTVTFFDTYNGTVVNLGSATLISNGLNASLASISTTGLRAGVHNILVSYVGDTVFDPSKAAAYTITIGDFNLTFIPGGLSVKAGGNTAATAILAITNGFNSSVALGCSPPSGTLVNCSFIPTVIAAGASSQLIVTTTASTAAVVHPGRPGAVDARIAAAAALGSLLSLFLFRRRRIAALLLVVLAVALTAGGCTQVDSTNNSSGATSTGTGNGTAGNGTPLGTISLTITAAATDASQPARHMYILPLTVQ